MIKRYLFSNFFKKKNLLLALIGSLILLVLLFSNKNIYAAPASLDSIILSQPDGSTFNAIQKGDERLSWIETLDGFSVLNKENTWVYAQQISDLVVPTDYLVGNTNPNDISLEKHIHKKNYLFNSNRYNILSDNVILPEPEQNPAIGSTGVVVIPIEFTDLNHTIYPNTTHSGSYEWHANGTPNDSVMFSNYNLTITLNASLASSLTLNFYTWHLLTGIAYVQASVNNGINWTTVGVYSGNLNNWELKTINLSNFSGNSSLKIKFMYSLTMFSNVGSGWYIDDISIPELNFSDDCETAGNWSAYEWERINASTHLVKYHQQYYNNMLFNSSNNLSMLSYYNETSYGQFSINGNVLDWLRSNYTLAYYGTDSCGGEQKDTGLTGQCGYIYRLAIEAVQLADPYIDFSEYDTDSDGIVDHVIIIHAGNGQESSSVSTDIWSAKSSIPGSGILADGVYIKEFSIDAERSNMGTFAHEFGHDLGLPDLYDEDYTSYGIGYWDIMAYGLSLNSGNTPSHFSAWSKYYLGWINFTIINLSNSGNTWNVSQAETINATFFRILADGANYTEYFIVENRQKTGFDSYLPGSGIMIYHRDTLYITWNGNDSHRMVDVEECDGGDSPMGEMDPWSKFYIDYFNLSTSFNYTSTPNSSNYDNLDSGVEITNFSDSSQLMNISISIRNSLPNRLSVSALEYTRNQNVTLLWNSLEKDYFYCNIYRSNQSINESNYNTSTLVNSTSLISITTSLPTNNSWYYAFQAVDYQGNIGNISNNTLVIFDSTNPILTIISPVTYYINQTLNLTVSVNENLSYLRQMIDFGAITTMCTNCSNYTYLANLTTGIHYIYVYATDFAGNNDTESLDVFVDLLNPLIISYSPLNSSYINSTSVISINYTEANVNSFIFYYKNSSEINFNNVTITNCSNGTSKSCNITLNLNYSDGELIDYYYFLRDQSGKSNVTNIFNMTIDKYYPEITVLSPNSGYYSGYNGLNMIINASINETNQNITKVKINGALYSSSIPYNWSFGYESSGNYTINISHIDKSLKTSSVLVNITIDNIAPVVNSIFPLNNTYIQGIQNFSINYTESYLDRINLYVNGTRYNMTGCLNGSAKSCSNSIDLSLVSEGLISYFFELIEMTNYSVNSSTNYLIKDSTAPQYNLSFSIGNGARNLDNTAIINISVSDNFNVSNCTLNFNGQNYSMNLLGNYCYRIMSTIDGVNYTYNVYVSDSIGNINSTGNITFLENSLPNTSISITPIVSFTLNNLTCENTSIIDLECDNISFSYDWYNGSIWKGINSKILSYTNTTKNQVWKCKLILNDSYETISFFSENISIKNTPPDITPVNNITINETSLVTVPLIASDDDIDSMSYIFSYKINSSGHWETNTSDSGSYIITINVSDGENSSYTNFTVNVINIPVFQSPDNISSNIENLSINIENQTYDTANFSDEKNVEFKDDNQTLVEFRFNFSKNTLDFQNMTVEKQLNTSTLGSMVIKGLSLGENNTKTIYLDSIASADFVCVNDAEIENISNITTICNNTNEFSVKCDSFLHFGYNCTKIGSKYKISGLNHSGIIEHQPACSDLYCNGIETCATCPLDCGSCPPTDSPSGGGGGGGGGGGSTPKKTNLTGIKSNNNGITNLDSTNNKQIQNANQDSSGNENKEADTLSDLNKNTNKENENILKSTKNNNLFFIIGGLILGIVIVLVIIYNFKK